MKKLLILTGLMAFTTLGHAQLGGLGVPAVVFATNSIPHATTNSAQRIFYAEQGKEMGLQVTFALVSATNSTVTLSFSKSLDGVNFENASSFSYGIPDNGTNTRVWVTNVTISGVRAIRLDSIGHTNTATAGDVTNFVLKASTK
jgi:hypothetical protein